MPLKSELMASGAAAALASKLGFDTPATVAAAGSGQSTAAVLASNFANVSSGSGGVILSERLAAVVNTSGGSINVYPPVGGSINGLAANTALAVGNNKQALFIQAGTQWVGILSA
jgi:hypothetical protein